MSRLHFTSRPLVALGFSLGLVASALAADPPAKRPTIGEIQRLDPKFDTVIPPDAKIEKIAEGFDWSEGPVWSKEGNFLLFSDVPKNVIYKWSAADGIKEFLKPSGYSGDKPRGGEPGSNGLTFDSQGRLIVCQHGDRRVARIEKDGKQTGLVDQYDGKRLNSPNDVILDSKGNLYFTDPSYGLEGNNKSPVKELDFNGVFRLSADGKLTLLTKELTFPNGLALSPDEKTLYVAVSDPEKAIWMSYDLKDDGTLANGRVFFDATALSKTGLKGLPDGMKVDRAGNVLATGPGGVLVFSPDGKHLGTLLLGESTGNCAFGEDGGTLYITSDMNLCRVKLASPGAVPPAGK